MTGAGLRNCCLWLLLLALPAVSSGADVTSPDGRVQFSLAIDDRGVPRYSLQYVAMIYRDSDDAHWRSNPYAIDIATIDVTDQSVLELRLAAGGGAAIRISPRSSSTQAEQ